MSSISEISGQHGALFKGPEKAAGSRDTFKETLGTFLNDVNTSLQEANDSVRQMAEGETTDLHQVMIASQKASISLELVVEIRNKLLESYREFMRMQI